MLNLLKATREIYIHEEKYNRRYTVARQCVIRLDLVESWFELLREDIEREVDQDFDVLDVGRTEIWFEGSDTTVTIRMSIDDFTSIMEGYYDDMEAKEQEFLNGTTPGISLN